MINVKTSEHIKIYCLCYFSPGISQYEMVEVAYKGSYHAGEGKYFPRWGSRFPSSYLYLKKGYALIDTLGNVYTRFAFIHSGHWFNEHMADMLPFDYVPDFRDK